MSDTATPADAEDLKDTNSSASESDEDQNASASTLNLGAIAAIPSAVAASDNTISTERSTSSKAVSTSGSTTVLVESASTPEADTSGFASSGSTTAAATPSNQDAMATAAGNSAAPINPTEISTPSDNGPTVGALAGGIVGAFFGGVILALLAAYVFSKRRRSPRYMTRGSKSIESTHGASNRKSPGPSTVTPAWERLIPQPADDEKMSSVVKSLLDRVALHVDNFYARKSLQISTSDVDSLAKIDTKLLPAPLPELMMDPNMQMLAIKHCIAFALTSSITPGDDPSSKILPIYLASLPRKLTSDPDSEKDTKAARQAYAIWKAMTSSLLPKLADEPLLADHRRQVITSIINDLSVAFRNWETSPDKAALAAQNLMEIAGVAYDVGMTIASQACLFKFERYQRKSRGAGETEGFVVMPGFNKIVDERGHILGAPQVLVRPTTHRTRRDR